MRTYLVEPQGLFAPELARVLESAGATIIGRAGHFESRSGLPDNVEFLFADVDGAPRGAPTALCELRAAAPQAIVAAYGTPAGESDQRAWLVAGADLVVSKTIDEFGLIDLLKRTFEEGAPVLAPCEPAASRP